MTSQNGKDHAESEAPQNALKDLTIGFIGSGVMGEAMISGLLNQRVVKAQHIIAADVLESRGRELEQKFGIRSTTDNNVVARQSDLLVLSVKPQVLDQVLPELHGAAGRAPKIVLSII